MIMIVTIISVRVKPLSSLRKRSLMTRLSLAHKPVRGVRYCRRPMDVTVTLIRPVLALISR